MTTFGDKVRVLTSQATVTAGIAGLEGQVWGLTTPSNTEVEVIGELQPDFAINVHSRSVTTSSGLLPSSLNSSITHLEPK